MNPEHFSVLSIWRHMTLVMNMAVTYPGAKYQQTSV